MFIYKKLLRKIPARNLLHLRTEILLWTTSSHALVGAQAPLNILQSPLHASEIFMWSISCVFSCCLGQKSVNSCSYEHKPNLYPVTTVTKTAGSIYVILALTFAFFKSLVCSLVLNVKQWTNLLMNTQATSKSFKSLWFINQIAVIAHGGMCFLLWSILRSLPLLWC